MCANANNPPICRSMPMDDADHEDALERRREDVVLTLPSPNGGDRKAFKLPLTRLVFQELAHARELTKPLESKWVFASSLSKSRHIEEMRRTEQLRYALHATSNCWRTFAPEPGVEVGVTMVLMNHKPPGVTWDYVTMANLPGGMRDAAEKVATISRATAGSKLRPPPAP